jgi:hypothetical protein
MNKKLFNSKPSVVELAAEYDKFIDETAAVLVRTPDSAALNLDPVALEEKVKKEVAWSSWVVSGNRRNFAWLRAASALNPTTPTLTSIHPTQEMTVEIIAKHIVKVAGAKLNASLPKYLKLRFRVANRMVQWGEVDPRMDSEEEVVAVDRPSAMNLIHLFYTSYRQLGIDPPALEVLAFDAENKIIEVIPCLP